MKDLKMALLMFRSLAALLALLLLLGCGPRTAEDSRKPLTYVVAIDTSQSSLEHIGQLFPRAVNFIGDLPRGHRLVIYRFDSAPVEVFDGKSGLGADEAGHLIKSKLGTVSQTPGTNLGKLLASIDRLVSLDEESVEIHVYTDCGTEKMTANDDKLVSEMIAKWTEAGDVSFHFHGVEDGHRERLRDLFRDRKLITID